MHCCICHAWCSNLSIRFQLCLYHAEEYKRLRQLIVGAGKKKGLMQSMPKNMRGNMNPHNLQMNAAQMSRMLPPQVLQQIGGAGALQGLLKQMDASGMK